MNSAGYKTGLEKLRRRIDTAILSEVRQKVERLKAPRSLPVRTGLTFQGELHPQIEPSDYFDFLIPFEKLLL